MKILDYKDVFRAFLDESGLFAKQNSTAYEFHCVPHLFPLSIARLSRKAREQ